MSLTVVLTCQTSVLWAAEINFDQGTGAQNLSSLISIAKAKAVKAVRVAQKGTGGIATDPLAVPRLDGSELPIPINVEKEWPRESFYDIIGEFIQQGVEPTADDLTGKFAGICELPDDNPFPGLDSSGHYPASRFEGRLTGQDGEPGVLYAADNAFGINAAAVEFSGDSALIKSETNIPGTVSATFQFGDIPMPGDVIKKSVRNSVRLLKAGSYIVSDGYHWTDEWVRFTDFNGGAVVKHFVNEDHARCYYRKMR